MAFIYKRAPLVEVIAEVHSELIPLTAIPGAAVDPFFAKASSLFKEEAAKLGYGFVERVAPDNLPLEMMPRQVVTRYRKAPEAAPLLQIGPGVFTANIVPPYSGWDSFRSVLSTGYAAVKRCYVQAGQAQPKPTNLMLRYINGFTSEHGFMGTQGEFLERHLGLTMNFAGDPPPQLKDNWALREGTMELSASAAAPAGSKFTLICQMGAVKGSRACVVEFRLAGLPGDDIEAWFNEANSTIRSTFEAIISDEVRGLMGPRIELT
jgi:uncharacterized protein (TIGR04255 family)